MFSLLSKSIRFINRWINSIANGFRIYKIRAEYPNAVISNSTAISKNCTIRCSDNSVLELYNCFISSGTNIIADHGGQIIIKDSFIGKNCIIVSREAIHIGSNCQIAEMVVIRDQNHNFGEPDKTITEQGFTSEAIIIEENVWLGAKATVTAGSTIAKNAVIGAHALVRGKLEANSLYVGTPAKKIKSF